MKNGRKEPNALIVGLGRWGKIMTKCLLNYGYIVHYANKDLSKDIEFEKLVNSKNLIKFKNNYEENYFDILLICVKPKDIFEAWINFYNYSKCALIEKPGPIEKYKLNEIYKISKNNQISTIINYEFFFINFFNLKKIIDQKKHLIKNIEIVWTKKLDLKGDLIWRIFPHMIAELFIFKTSSIRFSNISFSDNKFIVQGYIEKIPFIIKFSDHEKKLHFTKFIMKDESFFIKKEGLLYHNNKIISNVNLTTIENMLSIINFGNPTEKFLVLNKNLSLFVNRMINEIN